MAEDLCQGRPCRSRGWCSRETRQAALQLVLLCVASCSWTLLLISLTLTTSGTTPRHIVKIEAAAGPKWAEGGPEACQECLSRRGPPNSYWLAFERSLHQITAALDRLDQPLAPSALRNHLRATRTLLSRLASVLHLPLIDNIENKTPSKRSHDSILVAPEGKPVGRLACPEQFIGSKAGYPRYHKGYITINCSSLPLREVVTAVLWDIEKAHLSSLLSDFRRVYPELQILLVTNAKVDSDSNLIVEKPYPSTIGALKRLINNVQTPYVFLGTKLVHMTNHSRLERLVWVAEWTGVWGVGGAGKGQDGHWRPGCLQVHEGEGQLMYSRGYSTSIFECQLCHALETPLVMRTTALQKLDWPREGSNSQLLLQNMFLDIHSGMMEHKHGLAACPDSMFMVVSVDPSWDVMEKRHHNENELRALASLWHSIAKQHHLARIHLPSGFTVNYPCDFLPNSKNSHQVRFSPMASDRSISAFWACQKKEIKIILTNLLTACSKLHVKCYLRESTSSVLLSGGALKDMPNKTLHVGVGESVMMATVQQLLESSHYVSSLEGSKLIIESRWWSLYIEEHIPTTNVQWTNVDIVDGMWIPVVIPTNTPWIPVDTRCSSLEDLQVVDTAQEERMADLSSHHCNHNGFSDMTLRSP